MPYIFLQVPQAAIKNVHKYTHLINSLLYLILKKLDSEVLVDAERAEHA